MFVINLPPRKVWVRREYLRDLRDGHGEYVKGWWVSLKSIWGRSFYFETYLPEYGALYDKLPISAFLDWESDFPDAPDPDNFIIEPDLPLSDLQYWDSFDYDSEVIQKQFLSSMNVTVRHRSGKITKGGKYIFTIDSCHRDLDRIDLSFSEAPDEHKSQNCIVLPNGQIGLYPNNRCQWFDESLTPPKVKKPDFLVSTREFSVENGGPFADNRLGAAEEYFWETPEEKDAFAHIQMQQDAEAIKALRGSSKKAKESVWQPGPELTAKDQSPLTSGNDYKGPLYAPYPKLNQKSDGLEDWK